MISSRFPFVFVTMAQHYLVLVRTLAQDCHTGCLDTICSHHHLALLFCSTFSLHWGRNGDTEVNVVAHTCHPVCGGRGCTVNSRTACTVPNKGWDNVASEPLTTKLCYFMNLFIFLWPVTLFLTWYCMQGNFLCTFCQCLSLSPGFL